MKLQIKKIIKSLLLSAGLDVRRVRADSHFEIPPAPHEIPGSAGRPICRIRSFLEDIKARDFQPQGIIDVGANRGDWTRLALSIFPSTPVIMIEPQDEMDAALATLSEHMPNCHHIKAGAGREPGELIQTIWEDLVGSSFLPEVDSEKMAIGTQRRTNIITIDEILSKQFAEFSPDLVKLDIQGFELEALSGAQTLFGKTEVFILETSLFQFMEKMPITRQIIDFMAERGYELYDITEYSRRPHDGALGQVDLAFVKAKGMFREVEQVW
jgi:FkbM family methyltransferase